MSSQRRSCLLLHGPLYSHFRKYLRSIPGGSSSSDGYPSGYSGPSLWGSHRTIQPGMMTCVSSVLHQVICMVVPSSAYSICPTCATMKEPVQKRKKEAMTLFLWAYSCFKFVFFCTIFYFIAPDKILLKDSLIGSLVPRLHPSLREKWVWPIMT